MPDLSYDDKEGFFVAEEGDPVYRFVVQHSKSAQAKCRKCSEKIPKGVVRVGKPIKFNGWISSWCHLDCFWLEAGENDDKTKAVQPIKISQVYGFDKMDKKEQAEIRKVLKRTSPPEHLKAIDPDSLVVEKKFRRGVPGPSSLTVSLLPFQEEGYGWMRKQEKSRFGGGILADQMGMGKTIQTIALLCGDKEDYVEDLSDSDMELDCSDPALLADASPKDEKSKASAGKGKKPKANGKRKASSPQNDQAPGPALVVCPSSAMLQWYDEIKRCTKEGTLKVLVYHSANRHKHTPKDIMEHDVVLTSYPILEYDYRTQVNLQKVTCEYCNRKFLPHKLAMHLKYFCGPEAVRTERMQMRERKREQATKKAMATLNITHDTADIKIGKQKEKTPDKAFPTPSNIYRELMVDANRTPVPMYTSAKKAQEQQQQKEEATAVETPKPTKRVKKTNEVTPKTSRHFSAKKAKQDPDVEVKEEAEVVPRRASGRASAIKASQKLKSLVELDGSDSDHKNEDSATEENQNDSASVADTPNKGEESDDVVIVKTTPGRKPVKKLSSGVVGDARGLWVSKNGKVVFWKSPNVVKANSNVKVSKSFRQTWCTNQGFRNSETGEINYLKFEQVPDGAGENSSAIILRPVSRKGMEKVTGFLVRLDGETVCCCLSGARVVNSSAAALKRKWMVWIQGSWPSATSKTDGTFEISNEMVKQGWLGSGPNVGELVSRDFGDETALGVVVAYCAESIDKTSGQVEPELWHVRHQDGDEEDLDVEEMKQSTKHSTCENVVLAGNFGFIEIESPPSDESDFETPRNNNKQVLTDMVTWVKQGMPNSNLKQPLVKLKHPKKVSSKKKSPKQSSKSKKTGNKSKSSKQSDDEDYSGASDADESDDDSDIEYEGTKKADPTEEIKAIDKALADAGKLLKTSFVPATWGAPDGVEDDSDGVLEGTRHQSKKVKTASKMSNKKLGSKRKKSLSTPKSKKSKSSNRSTTKKKTPRTKKPRRSNGGDDSSDAFEDSDASTSSSSSSSDDEARMWAKQASQGVRIKATRKLVEFAKPGQVVDDDGIDLGKSLLHCIGWKRIILDEAHKIKDRVNSTAKSVFALRGDPNRVGPGSGSGGGSCNRWCLSGTPLQNRVGELYSLVKFLRVDPYAFYMCKEKGCDCKCLNWSWKHCETCGHPPMKHFSYFNQKIINPIKRIGYTGDGRKAMVLLHTDLIGKLMLRRTKEERAEDINLPPLTIEVRRIKMEESERDFYESVYKNTHAKFDTYVKKGTLMHNYAHIFELLSRLRQAVDHPYLVIHGNQSASQEESYQNVTHGRRSDVCGICYFDITSLKDVAVSTCRHTFHKACIKEYMENTSEQLDPKDELELGADGPVKPAKGNKKGKAKKAAKATAASTCNCPVCFVPLSVTVGLHGASDAQQVAAAIGNGKQPTEDNSDEVCVVCLDKPRDALLMPCGHIYMCHPCAMTLDNRLCPVCRQKFNKVIKVDSEQEAANAVQDDQQTARPAALPLVGRRSILQRINMEAFSSSSKTDAVIEAILHMLQENRQARGKHDMSNKAIVFSQYTSMLDIVEWKLKTLDIQTVKLVGSMSMQARRAALAAFKGQQQPEVSVILMSLKAGGEGLNLQEASHVLVLEPWWNPAVEMQAIQRAHRIGQKRAVHAIRFCVEDSIEEKMLDLQEKKKLVFEGTVDGSKAALSQLTEQDMRFLFSRG